MGDFWHPYRSPADATARLSRFADRVFGPGTGITWSDGRQIAMLRRPAMGGGHGTTLNVVRTHVSSPSPASRPDHDGSFVARARALFWHLMEIEGQAQIANAQAQMAASQTMIRWARDDVWEPAHRWMIGHKMTADGIGVAIDAIGVAAAVIFVVTFAPEIGAFAIGTAAVAATGSTLLFVADGAVFASEMTGHKATSEQIESNHVVQWARLIATGMTLIDVPVGGVRALVEVGRLGREVEESAALARTGAAGAEAARARIARIAHPARHPGPVARRTRQLDRIVAEVQQHHQASRRAASQLARTRFFDAPAALGATPAGAALIATAPPSVALTTSQRERDENYLKLLEPEGGMPRDVRIEMRTSSIGRVPHER